MFINVYLYIWLMCVYQVYHKYSSILYGQDLIDIEEISWVIL